MASELSKLIEEQLRNNGLAVEDGWQHDEIEADQSETTPLVPHHLSAPPPAEMAAHSTLMGALRVEARVKEQSASKHFSRCQKNLCVGGGLALVLAIFVLLIVLSSRSREGASHACMHAAPRTIAHAILLDHISPPLL